MKINAVAIILATTLIGSAASAQTPSESPNLAKVASQMRYGGILGAALDGASTDWVLRSGKAFEANPIAPTSTSGIVGFSLLKAGAVELAYRSDLSLEQKANVGNTARAVWTGAAANNILIGLGATGAGPIIGGIVAGYALWKDGNQQIEQAKAEDAKEKRTAATHRPAALGAGASEPAATSATTTQQGNWCSDLSLSPVTQALLQAGKLQEAKDYSKSRGCPIN